MPARRKTETGRQLGHYQLLDELGRGGMGVVHRALDTRLGRQVAIKLLPEAMVTGDRLARFQREARAVAALNHPCIVTIYAVEETDGHHFLTMELVEGQTLSDLRRKHGPLELDLFFKLAIQLVEAVSAAHEQGIFHRDLKPANVMVTPQGRVKVLDFGLAKLEQELLGPKPKVGHYDTTLTREGDLMGTLTYMAPEQIRREPADHRSDLFSLGIILYEMATGHHPFGSGTAAEIASSILRDTPSAVTELKVDLPRQLARILRHALEKDPERRFQSAKDLRNELEDLRNELAEPDSVGEEPAGVAAPPRWWERGRRRRWLAGAALPLALGLAAVATWQLRVPAVDPRPRHLAVAGFQSFPGAGPPPYFESGLLNALERRLRGLEGVWVVPAGHDPRPDLVIEADSRMTGDLIGISYRLLERQRDKVLGAEVVEGPRSTYFSLLDRIATDVARLLREAADIDAHYAAGSGHPTRSVEAWDLYLRGQAAGAEAALEPLGQALQLDPRFALAHAALGGAQLHLFQQTGDKTRLAAAREACERAVELEPGLPEAHTCLGEIHRADERLLDAVEEYVRAIELNPTDMVAYEGLRDTHLSLGLEEAGERDWRRVIALHPEFWAGHSLLGSHYINHEQYEQALEQYRRALELAPDNATVYYSIGGVYTQLGRYEEAIRALERSNEIRPNYAAFINLANIHFLMRRFDQAVEAARRSVELNPDLFRTHFHLARACYWAPGRRQEAAAHFERSVEIARDRLRSEPRESGTWLITAYNLAMLGRGPEGLEALDRALELRPGDPHYFYFAGLIHHQLGHRDEALEWLARSVADRYSRAEIRATVELDGLRGEPRFEALLEDR